MGGSRGKKKPKLRDYSHLVLSSEEKQALQNTAHSFDQHSIVTAILGTALLEHELDRLLRKKFKKKDDETWQSLQSENGPLRSFYAKIALSHALGVTSDKEDHDLDIVRIIRNAFAHSKKVLEFSDPLILQELGRSKFLPKSFKNHLQRNKMGGTPRASFIVICLKLQTSILKKEARYWKAKNYRLERKASKMGLLNALRANPFRDLLNPPKIVELLQQSSRDDQSVGPVPSTPRGLLSGLSPYFEDKKK